MTESNKKRRHLTKGLIMVIAAAVILLCGALTANAATGGALFKSVSRMANETVKDTADETLSEEQRAQLKKLSIAIDGKDVMLDDCIIDHEQYVDKDGTTVDEYVFTPKVGDSGKFGLSIINDSKYILKEAKTGTKTSTEQTTQKPN